MVAGFGLWLATARFDPVPLANADRLSVTVIDRHGQLLRAFTTPEGRWRLPVAPADVDPRYLAMLMAFEDRRFKSHWGVDPWSMGRAVVQFVTNGRIVSGGSTLTMQVARLLTGENQRSVRGKLRQMVHALDLERRLSKQQILQLYLRLAPFGGNLEGVRAASLAYFGKEPRVLSVGQAALLVALPQSPALRRPDRFAQRARRARDRVLERALGAGVITAIEARRARNEPVPTRRREFPKAAPHLAEQEVARRQPDTLEIRLTIDRDLQLNLQRLARDHARRRGKRISAALMVVEHATGQVLAHVGSSDYFDAARLGAIDMSVAVRSPGSTLKPLIYGLGFEMGRAHPETLIEDRPARFGSYRPQNFNEDYRGTVTVAEALAASLNIPAVKMLGVVGPHQLIGRLRRVGIKPRLPSDEIEPSLAIALGGLGLTLRELTTLYASLAHGGSPMVLYHRLNARPAAGGGARPVQLARDGARSQHLLGPVAAWYVGHILKSVPPPAKAKGGQIAYKTGTSYGHRDAWSVGFDGKHTIAVWIGRADGSSTPGLTGRTAAAPLLFDAFQRLSSERTALPAAPDGVVRAPAGDLPPPLRRFAGSGAQGSAQTYLDPPVQIAFPPDRSEVELDEEDAALMLKADGGALPLTWLADGAPIRSDQNGRRQHWRPPGRGFVRLSVIDAKGRVDRVTIRLR